MRISSHTGIWLLAGALTMGITSCSNDDEPETNTDRGSHITVTAPAGFAFVSPSDVPSLGFVSPAAGCTVDFYENRTADIHITGAQLSQGATPGAITLTSVSYTRKPDGTYIVNAENVTADGGAVKFDDIEMRCGEVDKTAVADEGATIFELSAETNAGMCLTYIPSRVVAMGTTVITGGSTPFKTTDTSYAISVNHETSKAVITVRNARFAPNMPSVGDMVFEGLGVTFDDKGGYNLYAEKIVPTIAGVPYPSFAITNVSAQVELDSEADVDISFMCNAMGSSYTVRAENLTYYSLGAR